MIETLPLTVSWAARTLLTRLTLMACCAPLLLVLARDRGPNRAGDYPRRSAGLAAPGPAWILSARDRGHRQCRRRTGWSTRRPVRRPRTARTRPGRPRR